MKELTSKQIDEVQDLIERVMKATGDSRPDAEQRVMAMAVYLLKAEKNQ